MGQSEVFQSLGMFLYELEIEILIQTKKTGAGCSGLHKHIARLGISGSYFLTFLCTSFAGFRTGFTLGVFVFVFAAFFLAN